MKGPARARSLPKSLFHDILFVACTLERVNVLGCCIHTLMADHLLDCNKIAPAGLVIAPERVMAQRVRADSIQFLAILADVIYVFEFQVPPQLGEKVFDALSADVFRWALVCPGKKQELSANSPIPSLPILHELLPQNLGNEPLVNHDFLLLQWSIEKDAPILREIIPAQADCFADSQTQIHHDLHTHAHARALGFVDVLLDPLELFHCQVLDVTCLWITQATTPWHGPQE